MDPGNSAAVAAPIVVGDDRLFVAVRTLSMSAHECADGGELVVQQLFS